MTKGNEDTAKEAQEKDRKEALLRDEQRNQQELSQQRQRKEEPEEAKRAIEEQTGAAALTKREPDGSTPRWVPIVALIIGLPVAFLAAIQLAEHLRDPPGVHIIDAALESLDRPALKIQVRNNTDAPALLTKAELVFDSVKAVNADSHASTEVRPAKYTWILTPTDIERGSSQRRLSVRLEGKAPDALEFILGFETRHVQLDGRARVRLYYDNGKYTESKPFQLRIVNGPGQFPEFTFPDSNSELTAALDSTDTPFVLRQIIGELANRQFMPAAPRVQVFFTHPEVTVRTAAAEYFVRVRDSHASPGLATLVEHETGHARLTALKALAAIGEDAFLDVERLLSSKDPAIREAALTLCGTLQSERSLQSVRRALDDRAVAKTVDKHDVLVAATAIRVLAGRGSRMDANRMVNMLSDPHLSVQLAAIDAARTLRLRQALPRLREIASRGNLMAKAAAQAAVQAIQP